MQVTVNQQVTSITNDQIILERFLLSLAIEVQQVAVAINQEIIPKSAWPSTTLKQGDDVAIFTMIAGG